VLVKKANLHIPRAFSWLIRNIRNIATFHMYLAICFVVNLGFNVCESYRMFILSERIHSMYDKIGECLHILSKGPHVIF
jgi:hypothetical protein